jgi:hypothetical protein
MNGPRYSGPLADLLRQLFQSTTNDPWPHDIDLSVKAKGAIPLCTNCLFPQVDRRWFCPHCSFPCGEFVATMPYLQIFPVGELFRRGVIGPPEKGIGQKLFLVLYSLAQYSLFAPVYWYWMGRKAAGRPIGQAIRKDIVFEESENRPD